jgi:GNAT superfamily N-acetyltransferase
MSITIVDFVPQYAEAFRHLNEDWIGANFVIEESDRRLLDDPEGAILRHGGRILVALDGGRPVGVCALVKHGSEFELSKFAVSPASQGMGIGHQLGEAALRLARNLGAKAVYLEGNTKMAASIRLYRRLGFVESAGRSSAYRRCNIVMEIVLS